jgi:hypothetical protein
MQGYIIKLTNDRTGESKFIKGYTFEPGNVDIDLDPLIDNALVIEDDEAANVLIDCLLGATYYKYGSNMSKEIIKVERITKVIKND